MKITPLKIYNGTPTVPYGRLTKSSRATLPINELKGKPPLVVCPILNLHRCKMQIFRLFIIGYYLQTVQGFVMRGYRVPTLVRGQNDDYETRLVQQFDYCDECRCRTDKVNAQAHVQDLAQTLNSTTTVDLEPWSTPAVVNVHHPMIYTGIQGNDPIMFQAYYAAYDIPCTDQDCEIIIDNPKPTAPQYSPPADKTLPKRRKKYDDTFDFEYDYAIGYDARDPEKCDYSMHGRAKKHNTLSEIREYTEKQRLLDVLQNEGISIHERADIAKQLDPPSMVPNIWKGLEWPCLHETEFE